MAFGYDNCCNAGVTLSPLQCCLSNFLTLSPFIPSCFGSPWQFYLQEAALPETATPRNAKKTWGAPKGGCSAEKDFGATQVNKPSPYGSRRSLGLKCCSSILRTKWIPLWKTFGHKGVGQGHVSRQPPARQSELGVSSEMWIQTDFFQHFS